MSTRGEVTALLHEWGRGEEGAVERLMPLVVDELRKLARGHFRHEMPGHTLQPTALVNEVFLKLLDQRRVRWENRKQFFAFASLLMRRLLVDHAKGRHAAKRGGHAVRVPIEEMLSLPAAMPVDLELLDGALDALEAADGRQARIVQMRFFGGLTHEEIAEVEAISPTTVKREWRTARVFLYQAMRRC
jgi:RNA polymerase sigma factor (TIGR02999 family)